MDTIRERTTNQCTGDESSSIYDEGKQKYSCPHKFGQQNNSGPSKQNGEHPFRFVTTNNERDMVIMPIQEDHTYCRIPPREAEHSGRLRESKHERLQQLDAEPGDLRTNQLEMGPIRNGFVCRPPEHSATTIHELAPRSTVNGNRCIPNTMAKDKRVCIPPILSDNKMPSKSAEGKSRNNNSNTSMANSTYYPMLLALSIDNPILLPPTQDLLLSPQGQIHPLMKTCTLKLVAWKVSGESRSSLSF
jgi:hypothetical protein